MRYYYDCCIWTKKSSRKHGMHFTDRTKKRAISRTKALLRVGNRMAKTMMNAEIRARPRIETGSVERFTRFPVIWESN